MTRVRRSAFLFSIASLALLAIPVRAQDPMNYPSVLDEQRRARQNRPSDARQVLPVTRDPVSGLPAELGPWLPLDEALSRARTDSRLVLLYVGGRTSRDADEWWFDVGGDERVRSAHAGFVGAYAPFDTPLLSELDATREFYPRQNGPGERRTPPSRFFVIDPGGFRILEIDLRDQHDVDHYSGLLRRISSNAARFVEAGVAARQGKHAEALLLRANALYDTGVLDAAHEEFPVARDAARRENNAALEQHAVLGIAAVQAASRNPGATSTARKIAEHAVSRGIAASAWLIVGGAEKIQERAGAARAAYEKALEFAEPGSEQARTAYRALAVLGVAVLDEDSQGELRLALPDLDLFFGDIIAKATAPPRTARVDFLVDGRVVSKDEKAPFEGRFELGSLPRPRMLAAAAYDASGSRLGIDSHEVNRRTDSIAVHFVSPSSADIDTRADVEVVAHAPRGSAITGVDLYWNETRIAAWTQPPFRHALRLPSQSASGYLRAVARGADGTTAEEVKMINSGAAASDELLVNEVELYAIVQSRRGDNIRGLSASDLKVEEDGRPVQFELRGGERDPITIGIMIDISSSMRAAMAETFEYAKEFIRNSMAPGDQVFVVAASDTSHLLLPLTTERQTAIAAIDQLKMGGQTALWDSVMFSISQFRSAAGKRALLVFTDGHDTASRATLNNVLGFAQQKGVPVYSVFPGPTSTSVDAWGNDTRDVQGLRDLSAATAGAVFLSPRRTDLPRIFGKVRDDTRAEYLLMYNSTSTRPSNELRKVKVSAKRSGIVVRAPSGYYPR